MTASIQNPIRRPPIILLLRIVSAIVACTPSVLLAAALPAAPQFFDTTYAPPSGATINVPAGGDFQAALNNAQLGDTIVLQAGATYTGPFTLPDKTSGSGWIYIVSSNYSSLPAPGTRVSPSNAANMPKIIAPPYGNAIKTVADSNHFRFVGIEFAPTTNTYAYQVIQIGNADTSPATLPNNIVFDRCYIHADQVHTDRRGAEIDGAYIAVIDSYVSGFRDVGTDTQALWAYNSTGPIKIVDDYLEAAAENVMIGGSPSKASSLVPSDIDIENNTFYKPLSWVGSQYDVKDLIEFKSGRRILVAGNTFENNPKGAQTGFAVQLTPRTQYGHSYWTTTTDIAFIGNVFVNVGSGFDVAGCDSTYPPCASSTPPVMTQRLLIRNNLIEVTGLNGADGRPLQFIHGGSDYTIDHNTIINTATATTSPDSDMVMADTYKTPLTNFVFTNNLFAPRPKYGFFVTGTGGMNASFSNLTFTSNALTGQTASQYPTGNFFPASVSDIQFKNYSGGDYTLAAGSPYKNAGTDGKDIGADLSTADLAEAPPSAPGNLEVN